MKQNRFTLFAWGVIGFTILVILWGAFVRATGSGAGCGRHWPTCNGEVIPWSPQAETIIEFTHRVTSGIALILVIVLLIWAYRAFSKGHPARLGALLSFVFIIIEALLGAALVIFELVADNDSVARGIVGGVHLMNTLLLLSVLTLTAWWGAGGPPIQWRRQGWFGWAIWAGFAGILVVGATGAMIALGDTLFPSETLAEGLQQKFSPTAHFLVRLRPYHPLIAIITGLYLIAVIWRFNAVRPAPFTHSFGRAFAALYVIQLLIGAVNVALLAPIWLQLVHLFVSDLILIALVLFMAAALGQPKPEEVDDRLRQPVLQSRRKAYN